MKNLRAVCVMSLWAAPVSVWAQDLMVPAVRADVSRPDPQAPYWADVTGKEIPLTAQPMLPPRPDTTLTPVITVQAVHDGKWLALRLRWRDTEPSEGGRVGQQSDAVAVQFPVAAGAPPSVFMGSKGSPVHIFHWRAQYQRDAERGKPDIKELYPNLSMDMYPLEYADFGTVPKPSEEQKVTYQPGRAEGNPQSHLKTGVDEIFAEGMSTSSVQEGGGSHGKGRWANGEWTVVITRELKREGGSVLNATAPAYAAFAVWQGGAAEVGSRKCVSMSWTPLTLQVSR